jgi:hypothetical protein
VKAPGVTFFQYAFLEYTTNWIMPVFGFENLPGHSWRAFGTYEMVLNLGVSFPVGK